jgi:hypothetical protein
MCHDARKIVEELRRNKIQRSPYPADSPDLSPCDFWLFELLKEKLEEHEVSTAEQIIKAITTIWDSVTFDEL